MFASLLAFALLWIANSLLAAAQAALANVSKSRLRQMQEAGIGGAALALRVAEAPDRFAAAARLAQMLGRLSLAGLVLGRLAPALTGAGQAANGLVSPALAETLVFVVLVALLALAVMGAGELWPEAWARRMPETAALWTAPVMLAADALLGWPVRGLLRFSRRSAAPLESQRAAPVIEEEIKTLVEAGGEDGAIEAGKKEMLYSVLAISETVVREIMVPRIDVQALEVATPLPAAIETVVSGGHSRIPVYEGSIDNILGLLYGKDLLKAGRDCDPPAALRSLLRPAYFVPETKKVDDLLAELQQQRVHMAIVVDEYGGVAGLVTLEDIVEEIVGEIRDEYDVNEESLFERVGDDEYLFDARINFDEVVEELSLGAVETDSDTLGGFIYAQLGRVPTPGETVQLGAFQFEVLTVAGRRIRKVRARRAPPPSATPLEENATHD